MENVEQTSGFEINTKSIESSGAVIQAEESKNVTENVIDVNQKGNQTANQDSLPAGSFTHRKLPSDLRQEMRSDQVFSKETFALEASCGVSELQAELEKTEKCQITDTEKTECYQNIENEKEDDSDTAGWTTQRKQRKRERRKQKLQMNTLLDAKKTDKASTCASACKYDGLSRKGKKKPEKTTPNYFLAIRVSDPQIHSGVKNVQDTITTHNKELKTALVSLATLHVTLMVMHLENAEQIQKATEVLNQCKISLEPILHNSALRLKFSGLGHFRHQVLFVKLFGEEEMEVVKSVENIIRETFTKEGIPSTDSRKFNPHLTVMKLSDDPMLRKKGIRKIPVESYASWVDTSFGEQPVNALHLCPMNMEREKDGFYQCVATVTFDHAANKPSPTETGNARTEDNGVLDNNTGDMAEKAASSSGTDCDKEARKNIEENASCGEDLSKELGTLIVNVNLEDDVINRVN